MASTTFTPMEKSHLPAEKSKTEPLDKAKEAGAEALGKAKEAASSVGEMASQSVSAAGAKANEATAAAGHGIKELGDKIAQKMPHDGVAGKASQAIADTIKDSGKYLEEAKLSGLARDVEQAIVKHPIPALLICFGVGFVIGRAMKE